MTKVSPLLILLACIIVAVGHKSTNILAEQIQLSAILPKLNAIHEDAKTLLIKNAELKGKILLGLQAQNEAKLRLVKADKFGELATPSSTQPQAQAQPQTPAATAPAAAAPVPSTLTNQQMGANPLANIKVQNDNKNSTIDYAELEEFNKWVEVNLDYAVKNTQASIEAFKEEAQQSNGNVDYSDQAIKDGIEGVKYWQSAVIFQDKTLKNEKIEEQ